MITRSWNNSPAKAWPARYCSDTPAVLAEKSYMGGLGFHSRCSNCNSRNLNQLRHVICLKFQTTIPKSILWNTVNIVPFRIVPQLTPIDLMDRQFSLEERKI